MKDKQTTQNDEQNTDTSARVQALVGQPVRDMDLTYRDKWIASIAFNAGESGVWQTCGEWLKDCADVECNSSVEDALANDAPLYKEKAPEKGPASKTSA